jgi:hypothetical protein
VVLQYIPGFFQRALVNVSCSGFFPFFHPIAINKFGLRMGPHILERMILCEKLARRSYRFDDIYCQGIIYDVKPPDGMFDHPNKFIIQNQLGEIEGDPAF